MTEINIQSVNFHFGQAPSLPFAIGVLSNLTEQSIAQAAKPKDRFVLHSSGDIVIDNDTGLWWPVAESDTPLDYEAGKAYCRDLRLGGFDDWRLPSRRELDGILVFKSEEPMLSPLFKTNAEYAWTSTETPWSRKEKRTGSSRSVFVVYLGSGSVNYGSADDRFRVRPVRVGGAARPGQ